MSPRRESKEMTGSLLEKTKTLKVSIRAVPQLPGEIGSDSECLVMAYRSRPMV